MASFSTQASYFLPFYLLLLVYSVGHVLATQKRVRLEYVPVAARRLYGHTKNMSSCPAFFCCCCCHYEEKGIFVTGPTCSNRHARHFKTLGFQLVPARIYLGFSRAKEIKNPVCWTSGGRKIWVLLVFQPYSPVAIAAVYAYYPKNAIEIFLDYKNRDEIVFRFECGTCWIISSTPLGDPASTCCSSVWQRKQSTELPDIWCMINRGKGHFRRRLEQLDIQSSMTRSTTTIDSERVGTGTRSSSCHGREWELNNRIELFAITRQRQPHWSEPRNVYL